DCIQPTPCLICRSLTTLEVLWIACWYCGYSAFHPKTSCCVSESDSTIPVWTSISSCSFSQPTPKISEKLARLATLRICPQLGSSGCTSNSWVAASPCKSFPWCIRSSIRVHWPSSRPLVTQRWPGQAPRVCILVGLLLRSSHVVWGSLLALRTRLVGSRVGWLVVALG